LNVAIITLTAPYWYNNLGLVLTDLGDLAGARTYHERSLEIDQATIGSDHPAMATRHNNLAVVLRELGSD
jgi:Tfp pilus assembly protein PilF